MSNNYKANNHYNYPALCGKNHYREKAKERISTDVKKRLMLDALKKSLGNVSAASERCGVNRAAHYDWIKSDPEYKREYIDILETKIDFVENKLMQSIAEGDGPNIRYFLSKIGHSRGYGERPVQVEVKREEYSEDEILAFIEAIKNDRIVNDQEYIPEN